MLQKKKLSFFNMENKTLYILKLLDHLTLFNQYYMVVLNVINISSNFIIEELLTTLSSTNK